MDLLSRFRNAGSSLLDFANRFGQQTYSPQSNPELESAAGSQATANAGQQYDRRFRSARAQAIRQGAKWYEMNDIAAAQAQQEHDAAMVQAVQQADALQQRRQSQSRMDSYKKAVESLHDATPEQKRLLEALGPEAGGKVLSEQLFPKPVNEYEKYSMTALGNGSALVLDRSKGTTEIVRDPKALAALGGAGVGVNNDAIEVGAQQYIARGTLPPLGNGKDAARAKMMMLQRAAEIQKANGNTAAALQTQIAANQSTRKSMDMNQKQLSATNVAENAMLVHFKNAINLSTQVGRSGVPVIDRWIQAGKKEVAGDPAVAAFHAALQTALLEYAKILSGGVQSSAMITEGAREEINGLLSGANTHEQLLAVYDLIVRDAHAKKQAIELEREELRSSLNPYEQEQLDATQPPSPVGGGNPNASRVPGETAAQRFERLKNGG